MRPTVRNIFFCLFLILSGGGEAQALQVTVKRVIFEGPARAEVLTIVNDSATEQTYRISLEDMRMTEDRGIIPVADGEDVPGLRPVGDMVRYSPRRVSIPPGGTQQVRLMVRRPAGLAAGEYRSHLRIDPEPPAQKPDDASTPALDQPQIALSIMTGLTMPVIVRQGALAAQAGLADMRITRDDARYHASFAITRTGDRSLYGDIEFACITAGGEARLLERVRGIAVYTEVTRNHMSLSVPRAKDTSCSQIRLRYIADEHDRQYGGQILAETLIDAP